MIPCKTLLLGAVTILASSGGCDTNAPRSAQKSPAEPAQVEQKQSLDSTLYVPPNQGEALADTPSAPAVTENRHLKTWAAQIEVRLTSAEAKSVEFDKISAKLRELGPQPSLDELKELVAYRRAELKIVGELRPVKTDLKRELFELWKMTGYSRPILAHARNDLLDHAADVCKEYRLWLKKNQDKELQEVISNGLAATIDSVRTEYCWAALDVLKKWIYFTPTGTRIVRSEGSNYDVDITLESREEAHRLMRNWYDSNRKEMKWSSELMRFVQEDDTRFQYPQVKLEIEF
jgi:hypothetical protein